MGIYRVPGGLELPVTLLTALALEVLSSGLAVW